MVDIHKPSDYPILLGDSLKDEAEDSSSFLGIRYNWIPKNGFSDGTGRLRSSSNDYTLSYKQDNHTHQYAGWLSDDADQNSQLALFYDNDKSAFILERVSAAFNLNVKSSSELSTDQIKRHPQLEKPKELPEVSIQHHKEDDVLDDADDDSPDQSNPFDYRHFLTEAKESVEKASHQPVGGRTPIAGARTPLNGISSPLPGATNRFLSTTPQFAPTEIRSAKRKPNEQAQSTKKATTAAKGKLSRKAIATTSRPRASSAPKKPLSSEIVVESSSSDSDAAVPSPPPRPEPTKSKSKAKSKPAKTYNRAISSPKDTDDDDDEGGLEIVDDSTHTSAKHKTHKINPDNFRRGQVSTPTLPHSRDIDMHNASDVDEDVEGLLPASDDDMSQNGDVPDLILEESEPEPEPLPAPRPKRRQSSTVNRRYKDPPILPQPTNTRHDDEDDDDDDDGGLAAALEEALEREAQMHAGGGGGSMEEDEGFGHAAGGGGGDEESEISEED